MKIERNIYIEKVERMNDILNFKLYNTNIMCKELKYIYQKIKSNLN